jgi:hypothetical protein
MLPYLLLRSVVLLQGLRTRIHGPFWSSYRSLSLSVLVIDESVFV